MVEYSDEKLDRIFSALSDPTRRAIVEQLTKGEATVGELAAPHEMTFQAISKHVRKLEAAGLVHRRRAGREIYCRIEVNPMRNAVSWIEEQRQFWGARLDRLEELLRLQSDE